MDLDKGGTIVEEIKEKEAQKVLDELKGVEIWKDITNYEGLYQVSSCGRVKNNKKILSLYKCKGYLGVYLTKNKTKKWHSVHRLVAETFLDKSKFKSLPSEIPNKVDLECLEVNHKDENKQNNFFENLEWCTRPYNVNYGTKNKRVAEKLSEAVIQFDLEGNMIGFYKSIIEASRKNNIQYSNIALCCKRKISNAGGFIWRYAKQFGGICNGK